MRLDNIFPFSLYILPLIPVALASMGELHSELTRRADSTGTEEQIWGGVGYSL